MCGWKEFEIKCTDYLNDTFGFYASFYHEGGSDSTKSDIRVETNTSKTFYIDAKHCPAQCGQFVLLPNISTRTFEYSKKNVNKKNIHADKIIDFMNESFDEFKEAGTAGKNIDMPNGSAIFSDWIMQAYKEKCTRFFIINDFKIICIDDFSKYFSVSAKYRIKRSGSGHVGKSRLSAVAALLEDEQNISSVIKKGDKLFVTSLINLHNSRFVYDGNEYMFSKRGSEYEVRKLSDTYNANVIFSIELKNDKSGLENSEFITYLN